MKFEIWNEITDPGVPETWNMTRDHKEDRGSGGGACIYQDGRGC